MPTYWIRGSIYVIGEPGCVSAGMYRILAEHKEVRERRNQLRHPAYKKPELLATGPNQLWSWDITKLKGPEKWSYYYLYVILDVYSRYVVGWMLAGAESAVLAKELIESTCRRQRIDRDQLVIHSDRGPSMTSKTVAQLLVDLGVEKSHSRPHVSNDNPKGDGPSPTEAQFKTMKYRPHYPKRFGSMTDARHWVEEFFTWYNEKHYHSALALLTPAMVHYGEADSIQQARQQVLESAYGKYPGRFKRGKPQVGALPQAVWINKPVEADLHSIEESSLSGMDVPGHECEGQHPSLTTRVSRTQVVDKQPVEAMALQ